jgi:hypothetical protein
MKLYGKDEQGRSTNIKERKHRSKKNMHNLVNLSHRRNFAQYINESSNISGLIQNKYHCPSRLQSEIIFSKSFGPLTFCFANYGEITCFRSQMVLLIMEKSLFSIV